LLALIYPWRHIAAVRWTLEHGDPAARIAATEYLDNLLRTGARRRLMALIEDVAFGRWPDLRTDAAASTLAELLRDEDPVIAAAATDEVAALKLWTLASVLEDLASRRDPTAPYVSEAAAAALASRNPAPPRAAPAMLPVVGLASRLQALSLFGEAAVGELLQNAALGEQVQFGPGDALVHESGASRIVVLLQGEARLTSTPEPRTLRPPALLGLREVLEGSPMRMTARAVVPSFGLVLEPHAFLILLSNNVDLIQGLARMLLESTAAAGTPPIMRPAAGRKLRPRRGEAGLPPVEKALLLREVPIFSRATATELTEIVSIAREVALAPGSRLFSEYDPPSLYVIVSGELLLTQGDDEQTFSAVAGDIVGAYAPLAGGSSAWRADALKGGTTLALTRDDLFELLTDRAELLQGVFRALFESERFRNVDILSSARTAEHTSRATRGPHVGS
jgi:CRP-like cAMP-binding protein